MAKELERAGLPTVLITNMVSVATTVGANRVVRGTAITHPLGDPSRPPKDEIRWREQIVRASVQALLAKPVQGEVIDP
jgi:glycine reductase complex component B subunit gamma